LARGLATRGELLEKCLELTRTLVECLHNLRARFHCAERRRQVLDFSAQRLDGWARALELHHLAAKGAHLLAGVAEPGIRLGLTIAESRHLGLSDANLLQPIADRLVRAAQLAELGGDLADHCPRGRHVADAFPHLRESTVELSDVVANGAQPFGLARYTAHVLDHRRELRGHRAGVALDLADATCCVIHCRQPLLAVGDATAQIGDALADGIERLGLELEPLGARSHFLSEIVEGSRRLSLRFLESALCS
jgi:hypothetical protein